MKNVLRLMVLLLFVGLFTCSIFEPLAADGSAEEELAAKMKNLEGEIKKEFDGLRDEYREQVDALTDANRKELEELDAQLRKIKVQINEKPHELRRKESQLYRDFDKTVHTRIEQWAARLKGQATSDIQKVITAEVVFADEVENRRRELVRDQVYCITKSCGWNWDVQCLTSEQFTERLNADQLALKRCLEDCSQCSLDNLKNWD